MIAIYQYWSHVLVSSSSLVVGVCSRLLSGVVTAVQRLFAAHHETSCIGGGPLLCRYSGGSQQTEEAEHLVGREIDGEKEDVGVDRQYLSSCCLLELCGLFTQWARGMEVKR